MQGVILQAFQWYIENGSHLWNHLKQEAGKIKDLGFTTVWLPPAYKGAGGGYSSGYDPYDLYDLGEFDQKQTIPTKYGSRDEYLSMIKSLKDTGLRVIADIVMNHKAGGDVVEKVTVVKVNADSRDQVEGTPFEAEAYTKFIFPGRKGKYSKFIWDSNCFTGVDYIVNAAPGIYKILNGYTAGTLWQNVVGDEKGNYDYLMADDIEFRNPFVTKELMDWGAWYYDQIQFDGVRFDAVKHMPSAFIFNWYRNIKQYAARDIFAVAELWYPDNPEFLADYITATNGQISLFDVALQKNFRMASESNNTFDMTKIFEHSLLSAHPGLAVTFVSNHDTQPLQKLESVVAEWFKPLAYSLILLRQEGYPCVFYPDLYGGHYKDKGKDDKVYEIWLEQVHGLQQLLKVRREYAFGGQHDYFDHGNCIGFIREGDESNSGCAVLMSNGGDGFKEMELGIRYAGRAFSDILQRCDETVIIDQKGIGIFKCKGKSVSVWIPREGR